MATKTKKKTAKKSARKNTGAMQLRESAGDWRKDKRYIAGDELRGVVLGVRKGCLFVLAYDEESYGIYANPQSKNGDGLEETILWKGKSYDLYDWGHCTGIGISMEAGAKEWTKLYSDMNLVMRKATTNMTNDGWQLVESTGNWKTDRKHLLYDQFAGVVLGRRKNGVLFVLTNCGSNYTIRVARVNDISEFRWKRCSYEWCESHSFKMDPHSASDWKQLYASVDSIKESFFEHDHGSTRKLPTRQIILANLTSYFGTSRTPDRQS